MSFRGENGHRFGIELNFDKEKVTFYHNGIDLGITANIKKGTEYWPVVSDIFSLNY